MSDKVEFLVFSDIHFHAYSTYSEDTGEYFSISGNAVRGVNTRLLDCLRVFEYIIEYAENNGIGTIMFCGDLFHSKLNVTKDVVNAVMRGFQYAALGQGHNINLVLIPGNHDYVDKQGTNHSLLALESFKNVHISNKWITIHDRKAFDCITINSVPYTENKQELIKNINDLGPQNTGNFPRILLAHCGIQGSKVGSDYIMIKDHDIDLGEVSLNHYDACFFGHYHEHQRVCENAWIVGATHEHVWSDLNGKRGFLHVTLEKENNKFKPTVKHIETPRKIPRFKLINGLKDLVDSDVQAHDFIRFQAEEELTETAKDGILGTIAISLGEKLPKYLELLPPKAAEDNKEDFVLSEKATSADSVLSDWVNHSKPELDLEKVLSIGKELLAEAKNRML